MMDPLCLTPWSIEGVESSILLRSSQQQGLGGARTTSRAEGAPLRDEQRFWECSELDEYESFPLGLSDQFSLTWRNSWAWQGLSRPS
jgi:hypothetical protein